MPYTGSVRYNECGGEEKGDVVVVGEKQVGERIFFMKKLLLPSQV